MTKPYKLREIYEILDSISPFELQEKWDNSGLNLGDMNQDVDKVYLALEATMQIAKNIAPNSLLITHHPLIFSPLKALNTNQYPTNIAKILLAKNCALISMHTNFDCTHLNLHFAKEVLELQNLTQIGIAQHCKIEPTCIKDLALDFKDKLKLDSIRYTPLESKIKNLFIVCGSGASFLSSIASLDSADFAQSCLISGDIKYHDAMSAISMGIGCIDVEHYASEREFPKILKGILQIKSLDAIICDNFSPFSYL